MQEKSEKNAMRGTNPPEPPPNNKKFGGVAPKSRQQDVAIPAYDAGLMDEKTRIRSLVWLFLFVFFSPFVKLIIINHLIDRSDVRVLQLIEILYDNLESNGILQV